MSSVLNPKNTSHSVAFSPVPDPWETLSDQKALSPPYPRIIPLDNHHELTGAPRRTAMMPQGLPTTLSLPEPTQPVRSAIAILLEEELRLAERGNTHLRDDIRTAIAVLELVTNSELMNT